MKFLKISKNFKIFLKTNSRKKMLKTIIPKRLLLFASCNSVAAMGM